MPIWADNVSSNDWVISQKHMELICDALKNFATIKSFNSPGLVKTAIDNLITMTIALNPFIPFFLSHDLFQELPPAVFNCLTDFTNENPSFVMPKSMHKVAMLNNCMKGSLSQTLTKKSMSFSLFAFWVFIILFLKQMLSPLLLVLILNIRRLRPPQCIFFFLLSDLSNHLQRWLWRHYWNVSGCQGHRKKIEKKKLIYLRKAFLERIGDGLRW